MAWNRPLDNPTSSKRQTNRRIAKPVVVVFALSVCAIVGIIVNNVLCSHVEVARGRSPTPDAQFIINQFSENPEASKKSLDVVRVTNSVPSAHVSISTNSVRKVKEQPKYGWINGIYHSPDPEYAEKRKRFNEELKKSPFKYYAEREISAIVSAPQGAFLFPSPIDGRFEDDFLKSLDDPIQIAQDDSPDVAEQKQRVIEAKKYIKEQMDAGVPLAKIISDARDEVNKATRMRENFQIGLQKLVKQKASKEDISDYVNAANMLLEKAGGNNIHMPWLYRRIKSPSNTLPDNHKESK